MNRLFCFVIALTLAAGVFGQTKETIDARYDSCFYNRWYDTCQCFLSGQAAELGCIYYSNDIPDGIIAIPYTTDTPIQIKGGVAMVLMPKDYGTTLPFPVHSLGFPRVPEYVKLYHYDANTEQMVAVDSARWDTITPKTMRIPLKATMDSFAYCYAYEAYFDSPVTVDSTFYLAGTFNNNVTYRGLEYYHDPTYYARVMIIPCNGCFSCIPKQGDPDFGWRDVNWNPWAWNMSQCGGVFFGEVLPLVDMNNLNTDAADAESGYVAGGGRFARNTDHEITAVANPGYHFLQWNDSVTTPNRTVHLTQDTLFTAYFLENGTHLVTAVSANDTLGTVSGSGYYHEGDVVTISALPADSCRFVMWTDSVADNPRQFVLTQDTIFTAVFAHQEVVGISATEGISFTLTPNPAKTTVTLCMQSCTGPATATLINAQGLEVRRLRVSSAETQIPLADLPAGVYLLTLTTPQGSSTQRLVVE